MKYKKLCEVYESLEGTTKRLEKTAIIAEFLKKAKTEELNIIVLLLQGRLFPNWDERKIGVASKLVAKAIHVATGLPKERIEKEWKKTGDLGTVAENLVKVKSQSTLASHELEAEKVFENLRKLATLEGTGTVDRKMKLIAELLTSATPQEARFIVRTILEVLRVGTGEGILRDAIAWAFFEKELKFRYEKDANNIEIEDRGNYNSYIDAVQRAYDLTNDFSVVAESAKKHGLKGLEKECITVGKPIKVMLALKVDDIDEGFERVDKPAAIEYKYDGFRMQIHKKGPDVWIFTRRLEDVTSQFPEVIPIIKDHTKGSSFILDSEAVGYDPESGRYLPFQHISQRIKRKYGIDEMAKELPVEINVFDILYYDGRNLLNEDYEERYAILKRMITPLKKRLVLAEHIVTDDKKEVEAFYKASLKKGNEGLMLKKLKAPYKPGARVGHMVKLKPKLETLDLVVIGAEWGEGKRAKWLSSYIVACRKGDEWLEIGRVSSGLKEKESEGVTYEEMTKELKSLIVEEKGRSVAVKPKIVIEVIYEEIQASPTYTSGFALRFPRIISIRSEKPVSEATTLEQVKKLYSRQKK